MKPGRALAQAQAAHWRRQPGTRRHGRRREPCSGLATSAAAESECRRRAQQPLLGRPGKTVGRDRWQGLRPPRALPRTGPSSGCSLAARGPADSPGSRAGPGTQYVSLAVLRYDKSKEAESELKACRRAVRP